MSSIRMWVVGALPRLEAATIAERLRRLVEEGDTHGPSGHADTSAWWSRGCDRASFFTPAEDGSTIAVPTAAGLRFADFIHQTSPGSTEAEAMWGEVFDIASEIDESLRFATAPYRTSPVGALFYGLGAEAASLLPGRFGDFLLTADEVPAALPGVEKALRLAGRRRAEVLGRIDDWMTAMGGDPQFESAELLEAPLRVLRNAADAGLGATAFTRQYVL